MTEMGWLHTVAAVVALSSGGAVLVARKGTRRHQRLGHLYVWSLVLVNATSFMLTGLFGGFGPFHGLAVVSLLTLGAGMIPAVLRRPRGRWVEHHARFMAWSYAGLAAAAASEAAVRLPRVPLVTGVLVSTGLVIGVAWLLIHGRGEALVRRAIRGARPTVPLVPLMLLVVLTALGGAGVVAQEPGGSAEIASLARALDRAVLEADTAALAGLLARIEPATRAGDGLSLHYLGYGRYRLAELLPAGQAARRDSLRSVARDALERSADLLPLPETDGLLVLLTGLELDRHPWKGLWLGRRWSRELRRAEAAANPRAALMSGVAAFHAPAAYGGGVERAERNLARALELFADDTAPIPYPRWGLAEAKAWLGRVRERQARPAEARELYLRALEIAPNYAWVRSLLARLDSPAS